MNNKPIRFSSVLLAASGLVLLGVMVKILTRPPAAAPAGPAWVESNAQALQATLDISTNPTEQAFIQEKLDLLRRIQATSAGSLQNVLETPPVPCASRPTELPTPLRTPGAEQFPPELYEDLQGKMNSRWQGEVNDQWVTVLAGVQLTDPPQPALWVFVENTADSGAYANPQAIGTLQITAADQSRLTLQDTAGTTFIFDISARAYLTDPNEVLPTLAPQPTFTPSADVCAP